MDEVVDVQIFTLAIDQSLAGRLEARGYAKVGDLIGVSPVRLLKHVKNRHEVFLLAHALRSLELPKKLGQWKWDSVVRQMEVAGQSLPANLKLPKPTVVPSGVSVEVPHDVLNRAIHNATSGAHYKKPRYRRTF